MASRQTLHSDLGNLVEVNNQNRPKKYTMIKWSEKEKSDFKTHWYKYFAMRKKLNLNNSLFLYNLLHKHIYIGRLTCKSLRLGIVNEVLQVE